jgi:hypothetical protein
MNYRIDHIGPTKKGRFSLLTAASVVHITKVNIFLLWKSEPITKNTVFVFNVHNRDSWLYKLSLNFIYLQKYFFFVKRILKLWT